MRKAIYVLSLVFVFALAASAQENQKVDVFLGYSYLHMNSGASSPLPSFNFNGGDGSFAYNFNRSFSAVADFGGYHNGLTDANLYSYMFGPRYTYRAHERFQPFAQILFGGMHDGSHLFSATTSTNAFALAVGGGVDLKASNHLSIRAGQVEYLLTRFNEFGPGISPIHQNNLRVSTGIVFRW